MTAVDPAEKTDTAGAEPSPREPANRRGGARRRGALILGGVCLAALLGVGLYVIVPSSGKLVAHTGACAQSLDLAQAVDPLVHGEVAALALATRPNELGQIAFETADGQQTTVAAFKGRTILLNLWATWCVPCRQEMPALDKLQAQLGSKAFAVVPVDVDTTRLEKARGFFKDIGATNLVYYADNSADILQQLRRKEQIVGLPTTILIGRDGCEIGTMAGPADWASPDARALIERLGRPVPTAS